MHLPLTDLEKQEFMVHCNEAGLKFKQDFIEEIFNAAGALQEDSGVSYKGALVRHINQTITVGERIAALVSNRVSIDRSAISRVVILQNIAKAEMFEPETSTYWNNKGYNYKFADTEGNLKCGIRGIYLLINKCDGVIPELSATEIEAITNTDKDNDDKGKVFCTPLTTVIRATNELITMYERAGVKQQNN